MNGLQPFSHINENNLDTERYAETLLAEGIRTGLVTEGQADAKKADLLNALTDVIGYYTERESSSLKTERVSSLSDSMMYNIDTYLKSLGDPALALNEFISRKATDLYTKGYEINLNLYKNARVLYGKVRLTRLKKATEQYDLIIDRYFYNYLSNYDARFTADDKIYLFAKDYGCHGAYHINGAVEVLQHLLEINRGSQPDVTTDDFTEIK